MYKLIGLDDSLQYYQYKDNNRRVKYCAYEYTYERACKFVAWLNERGYGLSAPRESDIGIEAGFVAFAEALEAMRVHCEIFSEVCEVLLCEQFNGLEGLKVRAVKSDGRYEDFYVGLKGSFAPVHIKCTKPNSVFGRRIREVYKTVKVISLF